MAIVTTLYADEYGTHIGKHSERLIWSKVKTTLAQAPLMHLEEVTLASWGVSISADAIAACCERGIPIYFVDGWVKPMHRSISRDWEAPSSHDVPSSPPTRMGEGYSSAWQLPERRSITRLRH